MKIHHKARLACAIGVVGVGFALVQIDLMPYRKANREFAVDMAAKALEQNKDGLGKELELFASCSSKSGAYNAAEPAVDYRACMMAAMPKLTTEAGVNVFAMSAAYWIEAHPEDTEFRDATNKALEVGWDDFRRNVPLYNAMDKVAEAHDKSFILRALHGSIGKRSNFDTHAYALERAELRVNAPALTQKQTKRRLAFIQ